MPVPAAEGAGGPVDGAAPPRTADEVRRRLRLLGIDDGLVANAERELEEAFVRARVRAAREPRAEVTGRRPRISYLLCVTPRSGSTLLADWLRSAGGCGQPAELYNPEPENCVEIWASRLRSDSAAALARDVARLKQTPNGVFAVKTDFARMLPFLIAGALDPESRFVYLTRRDLVAQSVSFQRAATSGRWHSVQAAVRRPEFDLDAIRARMATLAATMGHWEQFFSLRGAQPLRLAYEDVVGNPAGSVLAVARYLDVTSDVDVGRIHSAMVRLSDGESERWARDVREALAL